MQKIFGLSQTNNDTTIVLVSQQHTKHVMSTRKKELPCALCVFVLKPESCFLALQFEELPCSSNQISCACLESVQSLVFDTFKINITSPSYYQYIQCRKMCHIIHLIVHNMQEPKQNHFLPQKYLAKLDFNHHSSTLLVKINHLTRCFNMNIADPSNQ